MHYLVNRSPKGQTTLKTVSVRITESQARGIDEIVEANPLTVSRDHLVKRWVTKGLKTEGPVLIASGKKLQEQLDEVEMTGRHK